MEVDYEEGSDGLTKAKCQKETESDKRIFENQAVEGDALEHLDRYLSPESAARYLDVSRKFIYELMARREVAVTNVGGRLKRIRLSALDEWLNRQNRRSVA